MRRLLALLAVLGLSAAGLPAGAQTPALPGDCVVDETATVRVLLLIDQSGSLARTDPEWLRLYLRGAAQSLEMMARVARGGSQSRPSPADRMLGDQRARTVQIVPQERL